MAIYATTDKAALAAEMASWKAGDAFKAFESAFDTYAESVSWTEGWSSSISDSVVDCDGMDWSAWDEAGMDADAKFAFGMAA